jgi:transformation/transcription domain-associated protein
MIIVLSASVLVLRIYFQVPPFHKNGFTCNFQQQQQGHRLEADVTNQAGRGSADLSLSVNNLKTLLKLISERVLLLPECKRLFCQTLQTVLGEKGTDTGVLLAILELVRDWVEHDFKGSNQVASTAPLVIKDVVAFMKSLAQVDCSGMTPAILEEWDQMYLKLLHRLCSDTTK